MIPSPTTDEMLVKIGNHFTATPVLAVTDSWFGNAQAVTNHLNFCMMAVTVTWIYADRLKVDLERRHKVKGRTHFAFSDVRRIIAEAALDPDFNRVCPKPGNPQQNSLVAILLRMVA